MSRNFGSVFCNSSANKVKLLTKLREAIVSSTTSSDCATLDKDDELKRRYFMLAATLAEEVRKKHHLPGMDPFDPVYTDIQKRLTALSTNCNFTFLHTRDAATQSLHNGHAYKELANMEYGGFVHSSSGSAEGADDDGSGDESEGTTGDTETPAGGAGGASGSGTEDDEQEEPEKSAPQPASLDQLFRRSGLLHPGMDLFGSKVLAKCGRYLAGPEQVQNGSPAARGHYAALYAVPTVAPGLNGTLWVNKIECNPETGAQDLCVWVPANVMEQAFFKTKEYFKCQMRKRMLQLIDLARQVVASSRECGSPATTNSTRLEHMDALIHGAVVSAMQRRGFYGPRGPDDDWCTDSDADEDDSMFLSLGRKEDHYLHKPCSKTKGGNKYFNTDDMVSEITVVADNKPFKSSRKSKKSKGSKKSK
jgi:hypothetical protein